MDDPVAVPPVGSPDAGRGQRRWRAPDDWYGKGWPKMPEDTPPPKQHRWLPVALMGALSAVVLLVLLYVLIRP